MAYPSDPLEGLDYNCVEDSKTGYSNSLFQEPSWQDAARSFDRQRPVIPSSELGIPQSFSPKKAKRSKNEGKKSVVSADLNSARSNGSTGSMKKFSLPDNKVTDPKANELISICRSGWTLSKGQKSKPSLERINPASVENDIKDFAERYSDAKTKASASKGTDLNSIGERFQPQLWPKRDTISFAKRPLAKEQMFRAPDASKSTLNNKSFSFPKDIRLHPEKIRSPGPVFDTTSAYEAILTRHSTPLIGAAGRTLAGSIYYDQFNLKSHGNYYHANEAYLNHTTAPSARISSSVVLEPKKRRNSYVDERMAKAKDAKNPMTLIKTIRQGKKPPGMGRFS